MAEHRHNFKLPMPDGPEVEGVCVCGEKRTFFVSHEDVRARTKAAQKSKFNEMGSTKSPAEAAAARQARAEQGERERYALADSDSTRRIN